MEIRVLPRRPAIVRAEVVQGSLRAPLSFHELSLCHRSGA